LIHSSIKIQAQMLSTLERAFYFHSLSLIE
jgi:hypothetical protein